MATTLEQLPSEVLLEIFDYLPPHDLYEAFTGLNAHLTTVCTSLFNLHLTLHEDWDDQRRALPSFAAHVRTLIVKHDEPIDFSALPNIRSLKLCRPTANQCDAIEAHMLPQLEHLAIENLYFSDHSEQLCRRLLSSSFSRLHTCRIDRMTLDRSLAHCSSSLRKLTISPGTWKSDHYQRLLRACPNLTYLRLLHVREMPFSMCSDRTTPTHLSLRRLCVHFSSLGKDWFQQLDSFLAMVTQLRDFTLCIDQNQNTEAFPFDSMAYLLQHRVPDLVHFKARIALNTSLAAESDAIQQLHPLFAHVRLRQCIHRSLTSHVIIASR